MGRFTRAIILLTFLSVAFFACKREPLEPVNFLEQQAIDNPVAATGPNTDTTSSPVYFDADNSEQTDDGYHYKGTLYFKNQDSIDAYGTEDLRGAYPAATGDFTINLNSDGSIASITGQGSPIFPDDFPIFQSVMEQVLYTDVSYEKGSDIKQRREYKNFPLQDNIYYFTFGLDNYSYQQGSGFVNFGNTGFVFKTLFIDPLDPMYLMWGDLNFQGRGESFSISDLIFGVSWKGHLPFKPLEYPALEEVLGDLGFYDFTGNFYLSGTVPLDKFIKDVPLELNGEIVIRTDEPSGQDFYVEGPDASFILGANGRLFLTHDLLEYIPEDLRVEVGRATVEYETSNNEVILAGQLENQMASDGALSQMLGPYVLTYLDLQSTEAHLYARYNNPDDYMFYFDIATGFNIPGFGKLNGLDGVFAFSPDSVMFNAKMSFGFGLQDLDVGGTIDLNTGDFEFHSIFTTNIEVLGVSLYAQQMGLEISSELEGIKLWGSMDLGYDIASVYVEGFISADELRLSGTVSSDISFGDLQIFALDLNAVISSKTGVELSGTLDLPYGIGHVDVGGGITSDELYLYGHLGSHPNISFAGIELPALDLTVSASTKNGVFINTEVSMPYGIGDVKVTGELTKDKLKLTGRFTSKLEFAGFTLSNIDMYAMLSTDPAEGVAISGNVELLGGLGQAIVEGRINSEELYLYGKLASDLDLGFTSFHSDISVTLSSKTGIDFSGSVDMPFGIGEIDVNGYLHTDGSFGFSGSAKLRIEFSDDVYAEAGLSVSITNTSVGFRAYGLIHLPLVGDISVSIDVYVNWSTMEMTFKVHTALGDFEVTVDKEGKNVETGKQAVYRLD